MMLTQQRTRISFREKREEIASLSSGDTNVKVRLPRRRLYTLVHVCTHLYTFVHAPGSAFDFFLILSHPSLESKRRTSTLLPHLNTPGWNGEHPTNNKERRQNNTLTGGTAEQLLTTRTRKPCFCFFNPVCLPAIVSCLRLYPVVLSLLRPTVRLGRGIEVPSHQSLRDQFNPDQSLPLEFFFSPVSMTVFMKHRHNRMYLSLPWLPCVRVLLTVSFVFSDFVFSLRLSQ